MATQRGLSGVVALHGYVFPQPVMITTAVAPGGGVVTLGGTLDAPLSGVLVMGDTFTVAGVAGTYTVVTLEPIRAVSGVVTVPFGPPAPAGGFPQDAIVTFPRGLVANVRSWALATTLQILNTTVMQQHWTTVRPGLADWTARVGLLLDYGDPEQARLLDVLLTERPTGRVATLLLGASDQPDPLPPDWRAEVLCEPGLLTGIEVVSERGDLVALTVDVTRQEGWYTLPVLSRPLTIEPWEMTIGPPQTVFSAEGWELSTLPGTVPESSEPWELNTATGPSTLRSTEAWET